MFDPGKNGSFAVSLSDEKPIIDKITMISVTIVGKGQAEVRGLTTDGINSRWGPAERSETDPACWTGTDFEVCAT